MTRHSFLILLLFKIGYLMSFSQIGINTKDPQALLEITPDKTDSTKNIVVTSQGNVGIGTTNPTNKLTIAEGSTSFDLYLSNGAEAGSVLTSGDNLGNSYWKTGSIQMYTTAIGVGSLVAIPSSASYPKLTQFTNINFDNVKDLYGDAYAWNTTTQEYTVPHTGFYRISLSLYINGATPASTRTIMGYIFKNDSIFYEPGFITIAYTGKDYKGYVSGTANLVKGDKIDFRIYSASNNTISIWAAPGHTYFVIESL